MTARFAVLFLGMAALVSAQTAPQINGLDHINIAVVDLEAAAERYRDLGFSLKPGARHTNGIRNRHVKFPDGTELEGAQHLRLGRKIIGATVRVRNVDAAHRIVAKKLGRTLPVVRSAKGVSVFIPPPLACGLWLEFRQPT